VNGLVTWQKSSYSKGESNCVEVGKPKATWRKSTHSDGTGGNCVEVAETAEAVFVRDTQNRELGHLGFSGAEWGAFLRAVRAGGL
jgi:hypothetical protein